MISLARVNVTFVPKGNFSCLAHQLSNFLTSLHVFHRVEEKSDIFALTNYIFERWSHYVAGGVVVVQLIQVERESVLGHQRLFRFNLLTILSTLPFVWFPVKTLADFITVANPFASGTGLKWIFNENEEDLDNLWKICSLLSGKGSHTNRKQHWTRSQPHS